MEDRLLMRVRHAFTNPNKEFKPLLRVQLVIVAVGGDGHAGHVLHHEIRASIRSGRR
jgi:hypothetical protein